MQRRTLATHETHPGLGCVLSNVQRAEALQRGARAAGDRQRGVRQRRQQVGQQAALEVPPLGQPLQPGGQHVHERQPHLQNSSALVCCAIPADCQRLLSWPTP